MRLCKFFVVHEDHLQVVLNLSNLNPESNFVYGFWDSIKNYISKISRNIYLWNKISRISELEHTYKHYWKLFLNQRHDLKQIYLLGCDCIQVNAICESVHELTLWILKLFVNILRIFWVTCANITNLLRSGEADSAQEKFLSLHKSNNIKPLHFNR